MARRYFKCSQCGRRMRRFSEDDDGGRRHYYCPADGSRGTYLVGVNGWSDGWTPEILDAAVRDGIFTKSGRIRG